MDSLKFLGICILASSILLSVAIVWHGYETAQTGRWALQANPKTGDAMIIDTKTGNIIH